MRLGGVAREDVDQEEAEDRDDKDDAEERHEPLQQVPGHATPRFEPAGRIAQAVAPARIGSASAATYDLRRDRRPSDASATSPAVDDPRARRRTRSFAFQYATAAMVAIVRRRRRRRASTTASPRRRRCGWTRPRPSTSRAFPLRVDRRRAAPRRRAAALLLPPARLDGASSGTPTCAIRALSGVFGVLGAAAHVVGRPAGLRSHSRRSPRSPCSRPRRSRSTSPPRRGCTRSSCCSWSRASARSRRCSSRPTVPRALLLALIDRAPALHALLGAVPVRRRRRWLASSSAARDTGERRRGGVVRARRARPRQASPGCPWVPTFLYQRAHTGTPWSAAPTLAAAFGWFASFVVNQSPSRPRRSRCTSSSPSCASSSCSSSGSPPRRRVATALDLLLTGQPRARALGVDRRSARSRSAGSRAARPARRSRRATRRSSSRCSSSSSRLGIAALPTRWLQVGALAPRERARAVDDALGRARPAHPGGQGRRRRCTQQVAATARSSSSAPTSSARRCCATRGRRATTTVGYPRFTAPSIVDWRRLPSTPRRDVAAGLRRRASTALAGDKPFYLVWSVGLRLPRDLHRAASARSSAPRGAARRSSWPARSLVFYQSMNLLEYAPRRR